MGLIHDKFICLSFDKRNLFATAAGAKKEEKEVKKEAENSKEETKAPEKRCFSGIIFLKHLVNRGMIFY